MEASQNKLWVGSKKILVQTVIINEAGYLTFPPPTVTSPPSRKTKSKMTKTRVKSNVMLVTKKAIMPINTLTKSQKLVSVMVIFASITVVGTKGDPIIPKLQQISCNQYPTQFGQYLIKTFINLGSEVNTIQPSFATKLGFCA